MASFRILSIGFIGLALAVSSALYARPGDDDKKKYQAEYTVTESFRLEPVQWVTFEPITFYFHAHEFIGAELIQFPDVKYVYPSLIATKLPAKPIIRKPEWKSFHLKE